MTWRLAGLAGLFLASGTTHLVRPEVFVPLVPHALPARRELVYASGVAELVCAAALFVPETRSTAGGASAALLLAVFPGNVQMSVTAARRWRRRPRDLRRLAFLVGTLGRLPLQWSLIRVALSATGRSGPVI